MIGIGLKTCKQTAVSFTEDVLWMHSIGLVSGHAHDQRDHSVAAQLICTLWAQQWKRDKKLCSCIKISSNTWCELTQDVTTKFNPEKISILQSVSPMQPFFKCQTKDLQVLRECRIYKMFHVWVSPSWNLSDWASRIDSRESWLLQDIPMKKRKNNLL